jgi:hypothetical protein
MIYLNILCIDRLSINYAGIRQMLLLKKKLRLKHKENKRIIENISLPSGFNQKVL